MRRYTVARNQRVVGCLSPFSLVCFPLRFFWRVYVASLGNCHIGAALPVGHSLRPRTLSQLSHTATPGHMGVPIGSARTQPSLRSDIGSPSLILGNAPGVHPSSRPPRPLLDPGTWRRPSDSASTGPFSGPILPPWQKGGDLTTFLGGCGAKSWGSGGAPPTNLILLRNQRRSRPAPERARRGRSGSLGRRSAAARGGVRRSIGGRARPPVVAGPPPQAPVPHPCPDSSSSHPSGVVWSGECRDYSESGGRIWRPTHGTFYLRLRGLRLRRFALPRIQSQKGGRCPLSRPSCSVIRVGLSRYRSLGGRR